MRLRPQHAFEIADGRAGRDRQEDAAGPHETAIVRHDIAHHLRLHRDDDDFGRQIVRQAGGIGCRPGSCLLSQCLAARGIGFDNEGLVRAQAAGGPALQHRAAHLAAADKKQGSIHDSHSLAFLGLGSAAS